MINKQKAYLAQERLFLIEKFGPLLFFLIPLIILIIGGKSWAKYVAFLCQGIALIYIAIFYQARKYYLSFNQENTKGIPSRFYRIAWGYVFLILCVEAVLLFQ
ncbi:hypothetical protein [Proteus sp. FME41]|uniref:hypothetical protein n=1 Tax=Proteus sp. FME41 TaxID=2742608 RepID=UPI0018684C94|nr:hypothetical protein [Proteus sp. FME41]